MYLFLAFMSLILMSIFFKAARGSTSEKTLVILNGFVGIFLVTFFIFGILSQRPRPVPEEFTDILPIYPNSRLNASSPLMMSDKTQNWVFKTKDAPEMITDFYESRAEENSFTIEIKGGNNFKIEKDNTIIFVLITKRFGTYNINYMITQKDNNM